MWQLADSDKAWESKFFGQTLALHVMDVMSLATLGVAVTKAYGSNIVHFININDMCVFCVQISSFGICHSVWALLRGTFFSLMKNWGDSSCS